MARVGFNRSGRDPERQTQVTNRFRIVTVLSSPSSGPRIARLLRINPSLSRDSIHANCIESPVIMKSSPCTNPHNSRSRQHTIAGDHVPMTKPLSMITRFHFFSQLCSRFHVSHTTTSRVLRSSLRLSPVLQEATQSPSHWSLQLDNVPSKHPRTRSSESSHHLPPGFHISALESKTSRTRTVPSMRTFLASSGPIV